MQDIKNNMCFSGLFKWGKKNGNRPRDLSALFALTVSNFKHFVCVCVFVFSFIDIFKVFRNPV